MAQGIAPTFSTAWLWLAATLVILLGSACASSSRPPMPTVDSVVLDRFMGDWYVIASIPTRFERGAHNAVETYRLNDHGVIETTFTFRADSFDGPLKTYNPKGFVRNTTTNAEWSMQFLWPFKSEYLIVYLDEAYSTTMIGRSKRDYLWIMARTPTVSEAVLESSLSRAEALGYDPAAVQMVPQEWPDRTGDS